MEPIHLSLNCLCFAGSKKLKVNYRIRKSRHSTVNEYVDSSKTAALGYLPFFKKRKA